jgi:hypothetical protein
VSCYIFLVSFVYVHNFIRILIDTPITFTNEGAQGER